MSFIDQITKDIMTAMKARDKVRTEALRGIKKELIEAKTAKGASDELSDADVMKILQKMVKQRRDAAAEYVSFNRPELAEGENAQAEVIASYLPAEMTEEELKSAISAIVAKVGATSPKDMGKVMGVATKELAGKADGKRISECVKAVLSSL